MKKIDSFINQYSLLKTLRFKLVPIGKTSENFTSKKLLELDVRRAALYEKVKGYMDEYHRYFIDNAFDSSCGVDVCAYADLYFKGNKSNKEKEQLKKEAENLRKEIAKILTSHKDYGKLFSKEMVTEVLPSTLSEVEKLNDTAEFNNFYTYFKGFNENRKNIYTSEEKSTGIAYRCINDNLPKYLDNAKTFLTVWEALSPENKEKLHTSFYGLISGTIEQMFEVNKFYAVISQKGIAAYNNLIGGYTLENGEKIQGLNEYINLHNQTVDKNHRLPVLKMLFKQILSDRESVSFIPEKFENDNAVLKAINDYWNAVQTIVTEDLTELFADIAGRGIYIKNGLAVSDISQKLTSSWNTVKSEWEKEYDAEFTKKKNDKYEENRENEWKKIASFSLENLQHYIGEKSVIEYCKEALSQKIETVINAYGKAKELLVYDYSNKRKSLAKNDSDIEVIKNFLDSIKDLEHFLEVFKGDGTEEDKNELFYGSFSKCLFEISLIDRLYDKVRNYITQKPYSTDKIKLNFENPVFLSGWPKGNEFANSSQIFRRNGIYYLAVMDKTLKNNLPKEYAKSDSADDEFEKMEYFQMANPSKDIPNLLVIDGKVEKKNGRKEKSGPHAGENLILEELRNKYLPHDINEIRKKRSFSTSSECYSKDDLTKYIQYYIELIPQYYKELSFSFKDASEYISYNDFLSDVDNQAYYVKFKKVSYSVVMKFVDSGELYLFQIYNKDFSEYSKGTPNLHTLYFKMLFDERNLKDVVYQLNGGAEMFYRFPSIKKEDAVVHPKGQPIKNKGLHADKATSIFDYDLIKDKRFTAPQFSLHLPITLNFKAIGNEWINVPVRKALKDSEHNYVIGIDRGERHLVYITVVDESGKIVEQFSGNLIGKVDYHELLNEKEKCNLEARRNWTTIEGIKDLKEGYVSQIVHKVCELAVKYDAVIAMEDLNSGFKNSRVKVEKQVYQKFEKMLIDKLNYLADKNLAVDENGGLMRAYQLTEKFKSFSKMGVQNGFIFYVPAWLTSKIDPTTGFADLLKPKYTSEAESKKFIEKFKSIRYNALEKYFEFTFDYNDFPRGSTDSVGVWTICSHGERIYTHRSEKANGNYYDERINLTEKWTALFESVGIDWEMDDLIDKILKQSGKQFFSEFMLLLRLTLQMRNSVSNTDEDYLVSPVKNAEGEFYDSRVHKEFLPENADANGAYNIARKAHWAINVFKSTSDEELPKAKISISNKEWLAFAQKK